MIEIKIPSPGESIATVTITNWLVSDGSMVSKDQELAELESEKATLPLIASVTGKIKILFEAGAIVEVGSVACTIDENDKSGTITNSEYANNLKKKNNSQNENKSEINDNVKVTPLAREIMHENNISLNDVTSSGRKITSEDIKPLLKGNKSPLKSNVNSGRKEERIEMSSLRKKLSERLVAVKNQTAMLTTFNEVDMSSVIEIRKKYQEEFQKKYSIKLGFMSFFAKAAAISLKQFKNVNSKIEDDYIVYPGYVDLGIAVQTDKGLMVPIIRDAELLSINELEWAIFTLAEKARNRKISLDEMKGGTFTITNGGVFGSMLSTPILNPPQSAILGMHNITDRPVAINGKVEIRPIMYIALSYDHRVLDGKDSVQFLKNIKELLENPLKLLNNGSEDIKQLIGL